MNAENLLFFALASVIITVVVVMPIALPLLVWRLGIIAKRLAIIEAAVADRTQLVRR